MKYWKTTLYSFKCFDYLNKTFWIIRHISLFFDFNNNEWFEIVRLLVVDDGEKINYKEGIVRAGKVRKSKQEMINNIQSINPNMYIE